MIFDKHSLISILFFSNTFFIDQIKNATSSIKNTPTDKFRRNSSLLDPSDIERSIIDPSVPVGSLYDARKDSIVGTLDEFIRTHKEKINEKASSIMFKGEDIQIEKLLHILRIDDETRLATILKTIEPQGILSIVKYSDSIDNLTRLIYYFEPIEEQSLIYDSRKRKHLSNSATHVITKIKFGISLIIILQLSPHDPSSIKKINNSLEYFTSNLGSGLDIEELIPNEEQFLKNIVTTKIYSNVNDLSRLTSICEVHRQLQRLRQDPYQYKPLNFTLSPINRFYSDLPKNFYMPINNEYTKHIETLILPLSLNLNVFKRDLKFLKSSLLKEHLQQELDRADQLCTEFEGFYSIQLEKFRDSIIQIRSGEIPQETLEQLLDAQEQKLLLKKRDDITKYFNDLKSKNTLIIGLDKERIDYLNVFNSDVNQDDDQQTLQDKLIKNDRNIRIFCSTDDLKNNNSDRWDELMDELLKSRINEKNNRLVYADFSYSSYELEKLQILYPTKRIKLTSPSSVDLNKTPPKPESPINIVLFGESDVGKSTFINAFANYLFFQNIDQARSDEPIVLIPVSFLMTVNDQFDEHLIQFGRVHSNENHNNLGQTVTQNCKSYEFTTRDKKILKIIDTPGFGDTRGLDQDEKNLEEIFSYIQNLTHINALCILLKPNVKGLNPSFRTSFREILRFFGDQFYQNIFFCFTNSQSTFFTLGDTGPVLNAFLKTFQQMDLKKENTFVFDSNSFRYLVASQDSIKFDEQFIDKINRSWLKSVKESNRLVNQICLRETQKYIKQKWISVEQIKREINHLIRPMLEAIRNLCRNMTLNDDRSSIGLIQLRSIPVDSSKLICYKSDRSYQKFGGFYIMSDYFHGSSDQCKNEHLTTNYKLNYRFVEEGKDYSSADADSDLYGIIKACANFDYFLKENGQEDKEKSCLFGINRMITEEKSICEQEQSHRLNKKLYRRLEGSIEQYKKDLEKINSIDECSYLESICSRIEGIKQIPMIYEQLNPIQQHSDN